MYTKRCIYFFDLVQEIILIIKYTNTKNIVSTAVSIYILLSIRVTQFVCFFSIML